MKHYVLYKYENMKYTFITLHCIAIEKQKNNNMQGGLSPPPPQLTNFVITLDYKLPNFLAPHFTPPLPPPKLKL